jgi:hypothetical protein
MEDQECEKSNESGCAMKRYVTFSPPSKPSCRAALPFLNWHCNAIGGISVKLSSI